MHIFFSGIGGAGIGSLALLAHEAGYDISGSDKRAFSGIESLKSHGINDIHIGQTRENIASVHAKKPIDWFVYSSAVALENPNSPEIAFCKEAGIRLSLRDELLNEIITKNGLKLIAVSGTHGKSTTTAMIVWLFKSLNLPLSYSIGAKIGFGEVANYDKKANYFVYEADEFDYNFLNFEPYISVIAGVSWDHHEIFKDREAYQQAFRDFVSQSAHTFIWEEDAQYLSLNKSSSVTVENSQNPLINKIKLLGLYNRLNGYLAAQAVHKVTGTGLDELIKLLNSFPGLNRRMEEIIPNLFSDYAHTPEKIRGAMSVALEMAEPREQDVVIVYEPLTNRRQHYIKNDYKDCFAGAKVVYWLPSYLAREDPNQPILEPKELISYLDDPTIAQVAKRNDELREVIQKHLKSGDMVVCMNGSGSDGLDDWLRENFKE